MKIIIGNIFKFCVSPAEKINFWLLCVIISMASFVLWHGSYEPSGDCRDYLQNYLYPLSEGKFDIQKILVTHNHHIVVGYFGWFALPLMFWQKNISCVHMVNLAVGIVGAVGFYVTARTAFKAGTPFSLALLTAIMTFNPLFLASLINATPDFGVVCFFMMTMGFLMSGKFLAASVGGIFLVLSKEIGLPLYLFMIVAYAVFFLKQHNIKKIKTKHIIWNITELILPVLILLLVKWIAKDPGFIAGYMKDQSELSALIIKYGLSLNTEKLITVATVIFLPHYFWIPALTILVATLFITVKRLYSPYKVKFKFYRDYSYILFFAVILLFAFFVVSRIVPFLNPRYFLSVYPPFFLLFYAAMLHITHSLKTTSCVLLAFLVLLVYDDLNRNLRNVEEYRIIREPGSIIIRVDG